MFWTSNFCEDSPHERGAFLRCTPRSTPAAAALWPPPPVCLHMLPGCFPEWEKGARHCVLKPQTATPWLPFPPQDLVAHQTETGGEEWGGGSVKGQRSGGPRCRLNTFYHHCVERMQAGDPIKQKQNKCIHLLVSRNKIIYKKWWIHYNYRTFEVNFWPFKALKVTSLHSHTEDRD